MHSAFYHKFSDGQEIDKNSISEALHNKIVEECIICDGKGYSEIEGTETQKVDCSHDLKRFHQTKGRISINECDHLKESCFLCTDVTKEESPMKESVAILDKSQGL